MIGVREIRIPIPKTAKSLVWDGDVLVDWVSGGRRFGLDGTVGESGVYFAYGFDAVASLPGSVHAVIYERLGTKGLVLGDGNAVREINRSYYFAEAYEYPVAVFRTPSGREVLAHCPQRYNLLELEDLQTGEKLTAAERRKPIDFFHSRLCASSDGRYLSSAGWVWHPQDMVLAYDVEAALCDPAHLDAEGLGLDPWAESSSAAFMADGQFVVALTEVELEDRGISSVDTTELRFFDLRNPAEAARVVHVASRLGTIMPVDADHVLALYGHPRLVDVREGRVVREWPEIDTGRQTSSILTATDPPPPMSINADRTRFAVAAADHISVLVFSS